MNIKTFKKIFVYSIFFNLNFVATAYAYLDPGSGSIILQALLAGLATGLFYIKKIYFIVKSFFVRFFNFFKKKNK